ncbi:MBL fold metallo-hydrolase [Paenibacillus selenitireducens]|uniref:MBL fold metallo-hydrolase n=1 Tax=Paenibacillus selenitireducens TaxID=1324314 RepID=A0A1T2X351_9BACL|nr:MBL fold metallo-hydrolase [Paenibacillus selenitireducens]OPA74146.1 MBL fold metallo-hydrolase [Paenibacillus selenitireducens]
MAKERFHNLDFIKMNNDLKSLRQWRKERREKQKDYSYVVPHVDPDVAYLQENRVEPTVTWIGHSTFFIQYAGLNIVTDPVWANRMALQRRLAKPGVPIQAMPTIDVILISHSHYDHLHVASVRKLYSEQTTLVVPAGLKDKMQRKGFRRVVELHWWESLSLREVQFTFVPTQHWTRRTLIDTNKSHWGGYMIEPIPSSTAPYPTIHFVGDTGYFHGFKDIGERFSIDVSLMPIGAYEPEWFMKTQHVTPEEALQCFIESRAKVMIPMHYGAFRLADDTPKEALDRLEAERKRKNIEKDRIILPSHGETVRLSKYFML